MKRLLSLLFVLPLFATVNEPLRFEVFSGYRNDRIHWHLQNPGDGGALMYSEVMRDVQYWLNGLTLKVIHRDLTFFLRGAYGAFGRGDATERFASLPGDPHFRLSTSGWCADVSGYFGYAVNLTADRTYKVIFTPLIGYAGYFEQIHQQHKSFRMVWNGFFFGGGFTFETGGPVILNVGYAYNLMHNRTHASIPSRSLKTSNGGNGGQTGWAQIDWMLGCHWRLGIGGDLHYITTHVVNASIKEAGRGNFSEKFKLRWTPVAGWVQVSRAI